MTNQYVLFLKRLPALFDKDGDRRKRTDVIN